MPLTPRIAMVAGEASGDMLAGMLLAALKQAEPGLNACGIGGPQMQAQGFEAWWPSDKLAVRGYAEVLRHYREITGIRRQLADRLLALPVSQRPTLFVGVDAPDFNLDLEARLRAGGIGTAHFVSPSIWAWRGERIKRISRSTDVMLCVFPFEPALYSDSGVQAHYVGHPLADHISCERDPVADRAALLRVMGQSAGDWERIVAVLPGSRASEVRYLMPTFAATIVELQRRHPRWCFVIPAAPGLRVSIEAELPPSVRAQTFVTDGHSHAALAGCDVVLVASGTATLEALLFKKPMVIAYRMAWASWQMMKRMRYQPWVGLPNILARRFLVPEFLQEAATPQALADALDGWMTDPGAVADLAHEFGVIHETLRQNMPEKACQVLRPLLAP